MSLNGPETQGGSNRVASAHECARGPHCRRDGRVSGDRRGHRQPVGKVGRRGRGLRPIGVTGRRRGERRQRPASRCSSPRQARAYRRPRQQRGRLPAHAVRRADLRRMATRARHQSRQRVPVHPRRLSGHDHECVRANRQHLVRGVLRRPGRHDPLPRVQGRRHRLHALARGRGRSSRDHRERGRARLYRNTRVCSPTRPRSSSSTRSSPTRPSRGADCQRTSPSASPTWQARLQASSPVRPSTWTAGTGSSEPASAEQPPTRCAVLSAYRATDGGGMSTNGSQDAAEQRAADQPAGGRQPVAPYLAVGMSTVVYGVAERKHIHWNLDTIEDGIHAAMSVIGINMPVRIDRARRRRPHRLHGRGLRHPARRRSPRPVHRHPGRGDRPPRGAREALRHIPRRPVQGPLARGHAEPLLQYALRDRA